MSDAPLRHWTVRSSTYRVDEPFLRVRSDTVELPDGTIIENYFVRESRGFAIAVALTPERRIVLIRQYKHGIQQIVLELPAGMIDEGEAPDACVVRELAEETGYAGDPPELLGTIWPIPALLSMRISTILIRNAQPTALPHLDPSEELTLELVGVHDIPKHIKSGQIDHGACVAGLLWWLLRDRFDETRPVR